MRKAVQNSLLWERLRAERIIEAEGGICEAVAGDVSHADDVVTMLDGCIAAFGRTGG
jgi:hypothetical protein